MHPMYVPSQYGFPLGIALIDVALFTINMLHIELPRHHNPVL